MKNARLVFALSLVGMIAAPGAEATVLMPLKLDDMTRLAPIVVVGKVVDVNAKMNDEGTKIYTRATITIDEVLKGGRLAEKIVVKTIGGRLGDMVARVPGAPEFSRGEKVLVFLEPREDNDGYNTIGLYLGKFRVVSDPKTGQQVLLRPAAEPGVNIVGADKSAARKKTFTLDEVRELISKAGGGR